jgi:hypothetical protein
MFNKTGISLATVGLFLMIGGLVFLNPFNWFLQRSSRFSYGAFKEIKPGMTVAEVKSAIGDPINVTVLESDYWQCSGCVAYCFMGNSPQWLEFYEEAWVFVGPDDRVRRAFLRREP